jgi:hypothetical protein
VPRSLLQPKKEGRAPPEGDDGGGQGEDGGTP